MHIPDGFLNLQTAAATGAVSVAAIAYASHKLNHHLDVAKIPLMGVTGAFIFAAQMVNFPVAGGTSGHLLGATLAAILLGPEAAILIMTAVLGIQCLVFQDGGLLALGANILNMGVVGAFLGFALYSLLARLNTRSSTRYAAAFIASWISVMVGALCCSLELIASGTAAAQVVLPAMLGVHALIGVGEGVITVGALAFLAHVRPELWPANPAAAAGGAR